MRILVDGTSITAGRTGVGRYSYLLAEALAKRPEVEEVGVVNYARISDSLPSASNAPRKRWGNLRRILRVAPGARWLSRILRAPLLDRHVRGWSLFHEPNYVAPQLSIPLVTTVCDMTYLRWPELMPRDRRRWLETHLDRCLRNSEAIIAISEFTKQELLSLVPDLDAQRIFVTPLGVEHDLFHPRVNLQQEQALQRRYGLPERFILYLGTLEPRKNLQGLFEAYARLPEELREDYPLVLAGSRGWKESFFSDRMRALLQSGHLHYVGYVPDQDVPHLMRAASLFCFPSLYEGFGLPPLEAAACGTPVLCSRASSLPEVMGNAAIYVDPHSAEHIAQQLEHVLTSPQLRQRLSAAGAARAKEFTWQRCAHSTLRAYRAAA